MIVGWWYVQLVAIWHWYLPLCFYIKKNYIASVHSFFYNKKTTGIDQLDGMVDDTSMLGHALCALLTGVILKGLTLRKFVSDVCVCMFYVCEVIGFVD